MLLSLSLGSILLVPELVHWLGGGSALSIVGLIVAWQYLPPRLTIEYVDDNHPSHSFESRFIVKNIGKLPAYEVWENVYNCDMRLENNIHLADMTLIHNGTPTTRLDRKEIKEVPVIPQVGMPPGKPVESCQYVLELEYHMQIIFFKKRLTRSWDIELRQFQNGFNWQFEPR